MFGNRLENPDSWRWYSIVGTTDRPNKPSIQQAILEKYYLWKDDFSEKIWLWINEVIGDLHAADAWYYRDCQTYFCIHLQVETRIPITTSCLLWIRWKMTLFLLGTQKSCMNLKAEKILHARLVKKLTKIVRPNLLVLTSPGIASLVAFREKVPFAMKLHHPKQRHLLKMLNLPIYSAEN